MADLFHKIAIALTASLAGVSGLVCQTQAPVPPASASLAPQTAIIESAMVPLPSASSTFTTVAAASTTTSTLAGIIPNLLPLVTLPPFPATTTAQFKPWGKAPVKKIVQAQMVAASTPAPMPQKTAVTPTAPTAPITAQSLLNETTMSLSQDLDSNERITFSANLGVAGIVSWNLLSTTVGGTGSAPEFAVATSCTPPPAAPMPDDADQNPLLVVRTAYDCTVSLTPLSGADRRTVSKDFDFTTDPGRLVASVAPETDSLLQNNTNNGGFAFDNQDSQPVTITGLTVDVSFAGVATSNLLVLRFADPTTGASLFDYPLGNISGSATGVPIPLSLTIPANTQKVLPVEAIGVSILAIDGTNPTISVTLRGVAVSDGIATKLISPQISWTCSVPTAAYDPYATSSPFLTGQACGH